VAIGGISRPLSASQPLTLTLTAMNAGPDPATDVVLQIAAGAGMRFLNISAPGANCTLTTTAATCRAASLMSGQVIVASIAATAPPAAGQLYLVARVDSATTDPVAANNAAATTLTIGSSGRHRAAGH
jgi:uncharacterized repeat protein (TIGR01451 family)